MGVQVTKNHLSLSVLNCCSSAINVKSVRISWNKNISVVPFKLWVNLKLSFPKTQVRDSHVLITALTKGCYPPPQWNNMQTLPHILHLSKERVRHAAPVSTNPINHSRFSSETCRSETKANKLVVKFQIKFQQPRMRGAEARFWCAPSGVFCCKKLI